MKRLALIVALAPTRRLGNDGPRLATSTKGPLGVDDRSRHTTNPALTTFASAEPVCLLAAAIRTAIGCQRLGFFFPTSGWRHERQPIFFPASRLRQPCESAYGLPSPLT
jgi:hypothetical protein